MVAFLSSVCRGLPHSARPYAVGVLLPVPAVPRRKLSLSLYVLDAEGAPQHWSEWGWPGAVMQIRR